ncbi:hypothetical protein [Sulfitobacter pacificus]|uniref:Tail assembly chaperone n=1 Tax=Sulfitobacter pacificus TaxID=1499314 RepID=A0ABQ5VGB5_9RHOB|nr:hypothetical protein [Sulfitobacter pacificus]GLQ26135.1 hypothetical protein GCM10007927_09380 [Sulfitobacter pacificus]
MIGEHVLKWEGGQHAIKLSARAMATIEEAHDLPFGEAMQSIGGEDGFRIKKLVQLLCPLMNAGKGGDEDEAYDLIDNAGVEEVGLALAAAAEKAFPEAKKASAGNGRSRKSAKK